MTSKYTLEFLEIALKEWKRTPQQVRNVFKKKLKERLVNPHCTKDKLSGFQDTYKIKLKSSGYRLVYRVLDDCFVVYVIGVGKREKNKIYEKIKQR